MTGYSNLQTLSDIRWWTGMPIALMVGGNIVQVRARGTVTLTITAADKLTAHIPNPDDLVSTLTPLISAACIDALGELSQTATTVDQLTTVSAPTLTAFTTNIDGKLAEFGLRVTALNIEAIDLVM